MRPCWSGTGHRHAPGCLRGRSCRTGRRIDNQLLPSLSRATPSAVSEHSSELIGCPISRSLTTSCVRLELRSLPSTGITQLQRYYEPLRHPTASSLSLAGVRLVIPDHALGFPCCVRFPCVHAAATTPVQQLDVLFARLAQPYQPSPKGLSGRPAHRPFRDAMGRAARNAPSSLQPDDGVSPDASAER